MIVTKKVKFYKCNKCKHEWEPRRNREPRLCPKCKSVKWNDKKIK